MEAQNNEVNEAVFKVQLPTNVYQEGAKALAYNKSRSLQAIMPITEEILSRMNGAKKKFFWCKYNFRLDRVEIIRKAEWQLW